MCVCVCVCVDGWEAGCGFECVGVHGDVFHLMNADNLVLPITILCRSILTRNTTGFYKYHMFDKNRAIKI